MPVPDQPKIYHIVHVDRLPSVIAEGNLLCDAEIVRRAAANPAHGMGTTIGMSSIKHRRLSELQRDKQAENPASIRMRTRGWGLVGRA